ncbi:MAG: hypothetical protein AB7N73_15820 [Gemmatimonadales bacterium]
MTAVTTAAEETQAARPGRPYQLALSVAERADLHRRVADLVLEEGGAGRVTIGDVIRRALWPDGPPTS